MPLHITDNRIPWYPQRNLKHFVGHVEMRLYLGLSWLLRCGTPSVYDILLPEYSPSGQHVTLDLMCSEEGTKMSTDPFTTPNVEFDRAMWEDARRELYARLEQTGGETICTIRTSYPMSMVQMKSGKSIAIKWSCAPDRLRLPFGQRILARIVKRLTVSCSPVMLVFMFHLKSSRIDNLRILVSFHINSPLFVVMPSLDAFRSSCKVTKCFEHPEMYHGPSQHCSGDRPSHCEYFATSASFVCTARRLEIQIDPISMRLLEVNELENWSEKSHPQSYTVII